MQKMSWDDLINLREKSIVEKLTEDSEVILFGAGDGGEKVYRFFKEKNIKVLYFIDNDILKVGKQKCGLPIKHLSQVRGRDKTKKIVISSNWYQEISKQLENEGYHNYVVFPFSLYYFDNFKAVNLLRDLSLLNKIKLIYNLLNDTESKDIWIRMLLHRYTGNEKYIRKSNYNQYFHPSVNKGKIKNIIDGGAYNGDTIKLFLDKFPYLEKVYAFEPSSKTFEELKQMNLDEDVRKRVILYNKGLWSKNTYLKFDIETPSATTNKIDDNGSTTIEVTSIDKIIQQENIDYIKLDIEGSELEALKGAKNTIIKNRPVLAICIYHLTEHFWEIIEYLYNLDLNYNFHIGHHSSTMLETVLYAIPK